jgi:hypothetical protein
MNRAAAGLPSGWRPADESARTTAAPAFALADADSAAGGCTSAAGSVRTCSIGGTSQCRRGMQINAHPAVTGPTISKYSLSKG